LLEKLPNLFDQIVPQTNPKKQRKTHVNHAEKLSGRGRGVTDKNKTLRHERNCCIGVEKIPNTQRQTYELHRLRIIGSYGKEPN